MMSGFLNNLSVGLSGRNNQSVCDHDKVMYNCSSNNFLFLIVG